MRRYICRAPFREASLFDRLTPLHNMGGSKEVDEISPDKPWKVHRRRLARPPSLLSLNKNYARRMDTLFKKAYEASEAAIDDPARRRCRIAVIQELDGNRSVFLSHEDETWPPSRDTLHAVYTCTHNTAMTRERSLMIGRISRFDTRRTSEHSAEWRAEVQ